MKNIIKESFIPPFCTNERCPLHVENPRKVYGKKWYKAWGTYTTKLNPDKPIIRFMCLGCCKNFSTQSFSIDFAVKKKISYKLILKYGSPEIHLTDWANKLACSNKTLLNRLARLSRCVLQELAVNRRANKLRVGQYSSEFVFMKNLLLNLNENIEAKIDAYILPIQPLETLLLNSIKYYLKKIYKISYRLKPMLYYCPAFQNYFDTA